MRNSNDSRGWLGLAPQKIQECAWDFVDGDNKNIMECIGINNSCNVRINAH